MSIPLIVNGVTYNFPSPFDTNWAPAVDAWAIAVTNGLLQKSGGSFPLTAEVDFGNSFGLRTKYLKSEESNVSTTGFLRLASESVGIGFRDFANTGDILLTTNASDQLVFNGVPIGAMATLTNGHIFVGNASNQPADVIMHGDVAIVPDGTTTIQPGAVTASQIASGTITNTQINAAAAIAVTKLAAVTANRALASDASGFITPSTTTDTELDYVSGVTSPIQAQIDAASGASNPSGAIIMYGAASAPTGWLLCDGTSYLRASFPTLFAVIGTTFGSADGTHFNVPNMVNNVPIGAGSTAALGVAVGSTTVTPTENAHAHTISHAHSTVLGVPTGGTSYQAATALYGTTTVNTAFVNYAVTALGAQSLPYTNTSDSLTADSGSTTATINAVSVIQPSLGVTFIIKT